MREPWPEDAPDMKMLRRLNAQRQGRDYDRNSEVGDTEYAELLELAKGAKKKTFGGSS